MDSLLSGWNSKTLPFISNLIFKVRDRRDAVSYGTNPPYADYTAQVVARQSFLCRRRGDEAQISRVIASQSETPHVVTYIFNGRLCVIGRRCRPAGVGFYFGFGGYKDFSPTALGRTGFQNHSVETDGWTMTGGVFNCSSSTPSRFRMVASTLGTYICVSAGKYVAMPV
jgi:hypothetical protein